MPQAVDWSHVPPQLHNGGAGAPPPSNEPVQLTPSPFLPALPDLGLRGHPRRAHVAEHALELDAYLVAKKREDEQRRLEQLEEPEG